MDKQNELQVLAYVHQHFKDVIGPIFEDHTLRIATSISGEISAVDSKVIKSVRYLLSEIDAIKASSPVSPPLCGEAVAGNIAATSGVNPEPNDTSLKETSSGTPCANAGVRSACSSPPTYPSGQTLKVGTSTSMNPSCTGFLAMAATARRRIPHLEEAAAYSLFT